ncbi:MAG TPA: hypothetical protein VM487_16135 [Phycisphaerae bacterium]|nr:hypothetical protein [Phycisphaerae bacterium]
MNYAQARVGHREWPRRSSDWIGREVRTLREMQNGMIMIPAGTICVVHDSRSGLALQTDPCTRCGVRIFIRGVGWSAVRLLPVEADT